jgi:hypothetical protein
MSSPHRPNSVQKKTSRISSISPHRIPKIDTKNLVAEIDNFLRKSQEESFSSQRLSRSLISSSERRRGRSKSRERQRYDTNNLLKESRKNTISPYKSPSTKGATDVTHISQGFVSDSDSDYINERPLLMEDLGKDTGETSGSVKTNPKNPTSPFSLKATISPISPKSSSSANRTVRYNDEIEYINNSLLSSTISPPPSPPLLCEAHPSDFQVQCANLKRRIEALLNEPDKMTLLAQKRLVVS